MRSKCHLLGEHGQFFLDTLALFVVCGTIIQTRSCLRVVPNDLPFLKRCNLNTYKILAAFPVY